RATRAGVSRSPSRSGSSPTASRISRTAASIRGRSISVPTVDVAAVRDLDDLGGGVLLTVRRRVVAVGHRALLGLGQHGAGRVDGAVVAAEPDGTLGTLDDVLEDLSQGGCV